MLKECKWIIRNTQYSCNIVRRDLEWLSAKYNGPFARLFEFNSVMHTAC